MKIFMKGYLFRLKWFSIYTSKSLSGAASSKVSVNSFSFRILYVPLARQPEDIFSILSVTKTKVLPSEERLSKTRVPHSSAGAKHARALLVSLSGAQGT